jgi:hypothetical protein
MQSGGAEREFRIGPLNESLDFQDNDPLPQRQEALRGLVGDFGTTLFNPLACLQCTHPTKIVWDIDNGKTSPGVHIQRKIYTTYSKQRQQHTSAMAREESRLDYGPKLTSESHKSTAAATPGSSVELFMEPSILFDLRKEPLDVLEECPHILSAAMMQQLHDALPWSQQMCRWERCFAIGRDGDSFCTFLERCAQYQRTFVVIKTVECHVLGGYATMPWKKRDHRTYFGTGQSFLFASHPDLDNDMVQKDPAKPLQLYRWTGSNDFVQISDPETSRVGMGGGANNFGFLIQDNFWRGRTGPCGTFGNPSLVPHSDYFEIDALEVYGLRPYGESLSSIGSLQWTEYASSP